MDSGKTKVYNYQGTNSVFAEINMTRSKRIEEHGDSSKMCKIVYFVVYLFIFYGINNIIGSPNISNTWYVVTDISFTIDHGYFKKWIATVFSAV